MMGVHQRPAWERWFGSRGKDPAAPAPRAREPETVWVRCALGEIRRTTRETAIAEGWEIDERPGRDEWGQSGHGGVRREFMGADERNEVFEKTGVKVHDRDDMRKALAAKGMRHAEKGEKSHALFDALRECAEGHDLDPAYSFGEIDPFGVREPHRKPFDHRARFIEHCRRVGVSPD